VKTIGLIGGIGCASSEVYYDVITKHITTRLGEGQTGYVVLYSINEHDIYGAVNRREWDLVLQILIQAAHSLEEAGVDFIIICSNLFNKFTDLVQEKCGVKLLSILIPVCNVINRAGYKNIGLIGTRFTMTENFYSDYLLKNSTAEKIIVPKKNQIDAINDIIFNELLSHVVKAESKEVLIEIVRSLQSHGAECLILGCTEFAIILSQDDLDIPVLDTARLHAIYAADYAIDHQ
jgi:aspartate racemase